MPGKKTSEEIGASQATRVSHAAEQLHSADWEQRVLAARAKREKILAEKNKQAKTPATGASDTAKAAPKPNPLNKASARAVRADLAAVQKPETPKRSSKPPVLRAIRPPSETAPKQDFSALFTSAAKQAKQALSRNALIAVACCAALGFGLSFGFSTAIGLDGLSRTEAANTAQSVIQEQAQPTTASDLEADVSGDQQAALDVSSSPDDAVKPKEASAPILAIDPEKRPVERPFTQPTTLDASLPKIHVYAPDSVTTAALDQNKSQLNTGGFQIADVQRVRLTISAPHVRFYDVTDAAIASTLADDLQIEARDFSQSGHGAPGRIEVWLDGTSDRRTSRRSSQNPVDELIRLGNRFIRSLQ
ncbi:hypothetical protein [uncultured Roseobacter sp.]|uniref:hypothetical protein n=1 Tax=uncultured Roseobacter sp. TaxID=114847 RepID=UPI002621C1D9|nr:hypothetical protein [uncultured Roseobacter sp.]